MPITELTESYRISEATPDDFSEILQLATTFDLDIEHVHYKQFMVAYHAQRIVGFGRLISHCSSEGKEICKEIATVGVIPPARRKGIGSALVQSLLRLAESPVYVVTVIPIFFTKNGFHEVTTYPSLFKRKIDFCLQFCEQYGYTEKDIVVMQHPGLI